MSQHVKSMISEIIDLTSIFNSFLANNITKVFIPTRGLPQFEPRGKCDLPLTRPCAYCCWYSPLSFINQKGRLIQDIRTLVRKMQQGLRHNVTASRAAGSFFWFVSSRGRGQGDAERWMRVKSFSNSTTNAEGGYENGQHFVCQYLQDYFVTVTNVLLRINHWILYSFSSLILALWAILGITSALIYYLIAMHPWPVVFEYRVIVAIDENNHRDIR